MIFLDYEYVADCQYKLHYEQMKEVADRATASSLGLHFHDNASLADVKLYEDQAYVDADVRVYVIDCGSHASSGVFYLDDSVMAKEMAENMWKIVLSKPSAEN